VARGKELLEKELGKRGFEALLKSEPMQAAAERCNYHSVEDLLAALGYGELTLNLVVKRLREAVKARQPLETEPQEPPVPQISAAKPASTGGAKKIEPIAGVEGLLHHLAGCCNPIPGEAIIGVVTRTRGISIHRQGCMNVESVPGERVIPVSWNPTDVAHGRPQTYPVNIQIEVIDRVGVFKDILSRLSDQNINVRNAQVRTQEGRPAVIDMCIDICDHQQLERSFCQIKKMSDILNLRRVSQIEEAC
jgi:GTP pyrophosphokinase